VSQESASRPRSVINNEVLPTAPPTDNTGFALPVRTCHAAPTISGQYLQVAGEIQGSNIPFTYVPILYGQKVEGLCQSYEGTIALAKPYNISAFACAALFWAFSNASSSYPPRGYWTIPIESGLSAAEQRPQLALNADDCALGLSITSFGNNAKNQT
jgi:hypothetical protein